MIHFRYCLSAITIVAATGIPALNAQQLKKSFTVSDDIGLTLFSDPNGLKMESVVFSPDNRYFAVYSQRGRLDVNLVEDSISFYRTEDIKKFLGKDGSAAPPAPFWVVSRTAPEAEDPSTGEDRVIRHWRWLPDSSGMAFVAPAKNSRWQLTLADIRKKDTEALSPDTVSVRFYDIRSRGDYAYTAVEENVGGKSFETDAPAIVATGRSLAELFFPNDSFRKKMHGEAVLWAVVGGKRSLVKTEWCSHSACDRQGVGAFTGWSYTGNDDDGFGLRILGEAIPSAVCVGPISFPTGPKHETIRSD